MWVLSNALRLGSNTTCPLAIGNCFLISPFLRPRATLAVKQEDKLRLIYPLALKIITHSGFLNLLTLLIYRGFSLNSEYVKIQYVNNYLF